MATIGVRIELEGAPKYTENMKNLTAQTKLYQAQVKKLTEEMDSGVSAFTRSITTSKALQQQLQAQRNQSKLLEEQIQKTAAEQGEDSTQVIRLKTQYENLQRAIAKTNQALEEEGGLAGAIGKQFEEVGGKISSVGEKMSNLGSQLTRSVTVPVIAAGTASVKAFADWESAFAGVMKTVDETATTTYEDIAAGIMKMATETASSKTEIAAVAEAAGQLGVGADDLLKFTNTMIMLGDSTNLSAEEAATALARISNITGDSLQDVDRLGASIVALGNSFATNESSIVEMANRLASAGTIAGISTQDILALSAAMSSVGIEAEAGGTAMTQTLTSISKAASEGGAKLSTLAEISGMTAEEFANKWKTAPTEALQAFIQGLSDMNSAGQDTYAVLDELGMSGIRQSNMLQSLALASDQLGEAIEVSNKAFGENTALSDEAEKRYATFNAKLSQTKERISNVAIQLGEILMPYVEKVVTKIQELTDWFSNLDDGTQETIVKIAALAAAIGPILTVGGKITSSIGSITSGIGSIATKIGPLVSSLGLAAPEILAVVAAVGALIAIFTHLFTTNENFRNSVMGMWEQLKTAFEGFKEQFSGISESFGQLTDALWGLFGDEIMVAVQAVFDVITTQISTILTVIQAFIDMLVAIINGDWALAWENFKLIFTTIWTSLKTIATTIFNAVVEIIRIRIQNIKSFFTNLGTSIQSTFTNLKNSALSWGKDMIQNFIDGIKSKIQDVKDACTNIANTIKDILGFSLPSEGPLHTMNQWPLHFMENYAQGLEGARYLVQNAVDRIADDIAVLENPMSADEMYSAVRQGASDANLTLAIGDRELGRVLRDMGVVFSG